MGVVITKVLEFDAGHRVPSHSSKCRNAHGHRYRVEISVGGVVQPIRGVSDDGMILDFGVMKAAFGRVVEIYDHAFIVYKYDEEMLAALRCLPSEHKTVLLDEIPTAENLVQILAQQFSKQLMLVSLHVYIQAVRLFETPNSWADWSRDTPKGIRESYE